MIMQKNERKSVQKTIGVVTKICTFIFICIYTK